MAASIVQRRASKKTSGNRENANPLGTVSRIGHHNQIQQQTYPNSKVFGGKLFIELLDLKIDPPYYITLFFDRVGIGWGQ